VLDRLTAQQHHKNAGSKRLETIPGIGALGADAIRNLQRVLVKIAALSDLSLNPRTASSSCAVQTSRVKISLLAWGDSVIVHQQKCVMKRLPVAILGLVIIATTASSSITPAFALGGCGPNRHRSSV